MPHVMIWLTKPAEEGDTPSLEAVERQVSRLDYVSEVGFQREDSVVRVSFEGGRTEQEEIDRAIREVGYDIFKVSHTER